jgi:hypothetical protein
MWILNNGCLLRRQLLGLPGRENVPQTNITRSSMIHQALTVPRQRIPIHRYRIDVRRLTLYLTVQRHRSILVLRPNVPLVQDLHNKQTFPTHQYQAVDLHIVSRRPETAIQEKLGRQQQSRRQHHRQRDNRHILRVLHLVQHVHNHPNCCHQCCSTQIKKDHLSPPGRANWGSDAIHHRSTMSMPFHHQRLLGTPFHRWGE